MGLIRLSSGVEVKAQGPVAGSGVETWQSNADLPKDSRGSAVEEYGGLFYIFGGVDSSNTNYYKTTYEYDPNTDTYTQGGDYSSAFSTASAVEYDGTIYVIGGRDSNGNPVNTIRRYSPGSGVWSDASSTLPSPRVGSGVEVDDSGNIFIFGGENGGPTSTAYKYDVSSAVLETIQSMPTAKGVCGAAFFSPDIYVTGGGDTSTYRYDSGSDSYTSFADMQKTRQNASYVDTENYLYAIGGFDGSNVYGDMERWNPSDDVWKSVTSPPQSELVLTGVSSLNGQVFTFGGQDQSSSATVDSYRSVGYKSVATASSDLIAAVTNPDAQVRRSSTGYSSTGGEIAVKEGETIEFFDTGSGYLYTVGE